MAGLSELDDLMKGFEEYKKVKDCKQVKEIAVIDDLGGDVTEEANSWKDINFIPHNSWGDVVKGKGFFDKHPPRMDLKKPERIVKKSADDKVKDLQKKVNSDNLKPLFALQNTKGALHFLHKGKIVANTSQDDSFKYTIKLNSDDWIFSQATAVAGVNVFDKYKITPATDKYINKNGHAWDNELLRDYYQTFKGAGNYKDHDPTQRYGIILDAVLRVVNVCPITNECTYYVDCLIATNKHKDPKWAEAIDKGIIKFLSVGCSAGSLICTKCGIVNPIEGDVCSHIPYGVHSLYQDKASGKILKTGMLLSKIPYDVSYKPGLYFFELSYLSVDPAFKGACQSHVIRNLGDNKDLYFQVPKKVLGKEDMKLWSSYYKVIPHS